MFKAVIFDMDGVIIDSEIVHYHMTRKYTEELGIQVTEEELNTFAGLANKEIFTYLKSKHGLKQTVDEMKLGYEKRYMDYLQSDKDQKPINGVDLLIKDIYKRGFLIALASSACIENITAVLDKFNLQKYFNVTVSGCDFERSKPSPDIYLHTAKLLKVDPSECVVIEDSTNGIKAAKAAGMTCIAFRNPNSGNQNHSLADIIIDSFSEIDLSKMCKR